MLLFNSGGNTFCFVLLCFNSTHNPGYLLTNFTLHQTSLRISIDVGIGKKSWIKLFPSFLFSVFKYGKYANCVCPCDCFVGPMCQICLRLVTMLFQLIKKFEIEMIQPNTIPRILSTCIYFLDIFKLFWIELCLLFSSPDKYNPFNILTYQILVYLSIIKQLQQISKINK